MKKLTTVLVAVLLTLTSFGQLNENAKLLKAYAVDDYEQIKTASVREWGENHEMVLYMINNQSDAFLEVADILTEGNYDSELLTSAFKEYGETIEGIFYINYVMTLYTYREQMKAKSQY